MREIGYLDVGVHVSGFTRRMVNPRRAYRITIRRWSSQVVTPEIWRWQQTACETNGSKGRSLWLGNFPPSGWADSRLTGMCVYSATISDAKPRPPIARASDRRSMLYSLTNVEIPNSIATSSAGLNTRCIPARSLQKANFQQPQAYRSRLTRHPAFGVSSKIHIPLELRGGPSRLHDSAEKRHSAGATHVYFINFADAHLD